MPMTRRREFSRKVKAAALERCKDSKGVPRCECGCGAQIFRGEEEYDHVLADGLGGKPTLENCAVVRRTPCHSYKSRKHDIPMIAKADRLRAKHIGAKPKRPWGGKYRKKMDGSVVLR